MSDEVKERKVVIEGVPHTILKALFATRSDVESRFKQEIAELNAAIEELVTGAVGKAGYPEGINWTLTAEDKRFILTEVPKQVEGESE